MDNIKEAKKQKMAYVWAILTIIVTIVVGVGVLSFSNDLLPIFLAAIAVLFGPICGIIYIVEIRKGVLSVENDEDE